MRWRKGHWECLPQQSRLQPRPPLLVVLLAASLLATLLPHMLGHASEELPQPYGDGPHGPSVTHEEIAAILTRARREAATNVTATEAPPKNESVVLTYETLKVNASLFVNRTSGFVETQRFPYNTQQAHLSLALDPVRTVSFLEPGGIGGCPTDNNPVDGRVRPSETVRMEAAHARSEGCVAAINAGFFNTHNGTCYGNFISRGRTVQLPGLFNANFGIRADGTLVMGYIPLSVLEEQDNPFVQLIAGCLWLVRDGKSYLYESMKVENQGVEETGALSYFAAIQSARTAIGYGSDGIVRMVQVDGKSFQKGVNLWEFANILISLNFTNAINLDGGGSAVTILNGSVASFPSDSCKPSDCDCSRFPNATDCANYCKLFTCERPVTSIICMHNPLCNDGRGCGPHGVCVNGTCLCTSEDWGGPACETHLCNAGQGCGANGTCIRGACVCSKGWLGPACSQPDCNAGLGCSGHGACIQGVCTCFQGWRGEACEIAHPEQQLAPWQVSTVLLSIATAGLLLSNIIACARIPNRAANYSHLSKSTLQWRLGINKYSRLKNAEEEGITLTEDNITQDKEFASLAL